MSGYQHLGAWLALYFCCAGPGRAEDVQEIIRRATAAVKADWAVDSDYARVARDEVQKSGTLTSRTSQVLMIDGSDYYLPMAINDQPLTPEQKSAEINKLKNEIQRRKSESPAARQQRIGNYGKQRDENGAMLLEIPKASFELLREETVNGCRVYVISAVPGKITGSLSRAAKVLSGMRGTLWVDKDNFQVVRAEGKVVTPVPIYGILAQVLPGTFIQIDMTPVTDSVWLVGRVSMTLTVSKFFWFKSTQVKRSTYSEYRLNGLAIDELLGSADRSAARETTQFIQPNHARSCFFPEGRASSRESNEAP